MKRFTGRVREVLALATRLATERSQTPVGTLHLLAALLDRGALYVLARLGTDLPTLREAMASALELGSSEAGSAAEYSVRAALAIRSSIDAASTAGADYVGTEHLLMGLLDQQSCDAVKVLSAFGVHRDSVLEAMKEWLAEQAVDPVERAKEFAQERRGGTPPVKAGLCQACGVEPSTVHFTNIEDSAMTEAHLCDECAREAGVDWL